MDFGRAVGVAFNVGSNRKLRDGEVDETAQIGWGHALIGIAILVVAQLGLIFYSASGGVDGEVLRDLSIVAFGALIVPFVLFWLGATITRTMPRLPGAFLYLSITLAVLQVITAVLASFGTGQSGFVIGILVAVTFLAARGFLRMHWFPALVMGILVVAGFIGANFVLLMLPTGRLLR
jgi:hypothetical protein